MFNDEITETKATPEIVGLKEGGPVGETLGLVVGLEVGVLVGSRDGLQRTLNPVGLEHAGLPIAGC